MGQDIKNHGANSDHSCINVVPNVALVSLMSLILSTLPNKFSVETGGGGGEEVLPPAPSFSNYAAKISLDKGNNYGYQFDIPTQYRDGNIFNIGFFFSMTGVAHCIFDVTVLVPRPIMCTISIYPDTVQTDKARIYAMECYSRGTYSTAPRYWKWWLWGTTAEKTYGHIPLIEPNKWYYVFASFDVASNTRNTNLDFAKFNGLEFHSSTLGGGDPGGYQPAQGYANLVIGLASRYTLNNTAGLFAYVYGLTMNWGTTQTLTPPTGYASWREYADSMMWWRPEEGGQMPEPLANDHMIRSFTSSSNLTSSDGLIRASYTSFEGRAPTNATVPNKYIVEPSSSTETNYGEMEWTGGNTSLTSSTAFYALTSIERCFVVFVFKFERTYFSKSAPEWTIGGNTLNIRAQNLSGATPSFYNLSFKSTGLPDIIREIKIPNTASIPSDGWACFLCYLDNTGTGWGSLNKLLLTIASSTSTFSAASNLSYRLETRASTDAWKTTLRYCAFYCNEQMTEGEGALIPWGDKEAMENRFYSSGNALKPNLARAVPYVKPFILFDADSPRGFGMVKTGHEKLPDETGSLFTPGVSDTYLYFFSGNISTGPRVAIKRKAGPIIVGAD